MSSTNAAPMWGRTDNGTRVVGIARDRERRRIRRHLEATTQSALERIATAGDDVTAAELERLADAEATRLRDYLEHLGRQDRHHGAPPRRGGWSPKPLSDGASRARADIRGWVCCALHDTTLQTLEYMSADGYGAELTVSDLRRLANQALADLQQRLDRLGEEAPCELVEGLQSVIAEATVLGLRNVELLVGDVDNSITGGDAAALVAAVREALNNVRKHSHATHVLVTCDATDGEAHITVRDNGVGVDPGALGDGLGVRQSIFQRMSTRGGRAWLDSAPGQGVIVTLKMANADRVAS